MHDVIIIGAGPIGSYTAYLLAKEGLDVAILEEHSDVGEGVNCAGIVSTECFKNFDLPTETILKSIEAIKAFSPSGNCVEYRTGSTIAHVVNRSLFDSEIARMAVKEGATLYLKTKVKEISITDSAFKAKTERAGEEFSSNVGVIATGFELIPLIPRRPERFLYAVQTDGEVRDIKGIEVYFGREIAPGSFAWVVPTNGKTAKIGLITDKDPAAYLKGFLQSPLIKHRLEACDNQIRCSPIPVKGIPKSYAERLVVVGEAAGQVKATTGGGIYFGFLCSEIAARTILKAFRQEDFSERLFKEYEVGWKNKLSLELKLGYYLRNLYARLSDNQIDVLINLVGKDGLPIIMKKADFDWHKGLIVSLLQHTLFRKLFRT
ncbi:MAG: NAD(P)/FAD-dependent oxidoreductase [Nitrospirae bacterium]|nr:NAD(P)/FAD-dependent oxidoreductase [Nitrospirota bacterium]